VRKARKANPGIVEESLWSFLLHSYFPLPLSKRTKNKCLVQCQSMSGRKARAGPGLTGGWSFLVSKTRQIYRSKNYDGEGGFKEKKGHTRVQ
jgi:hypothetical protein